MQRTHTYSWVLIIFIVGTGLAPDRTIAGAQAIIINEVMANPANESTGEFVELFNTGDTPIDVTGWILADRSDINDVITDFRGPYDLGQPGAVIPPQGYALIVDPDYDGTYNTWIEAHADLSHLVMLTINGDRTLGNGIGNSGDTVILDAGDGWSARFEWSSDAGGDGVSWEKILPGPDDRLSNWAPSKSGSTPGARNSVTPARYDAGVSPGTFMIMPGFPAVDEVITASILVRNEGLAPLSNITVVFFVDTDRDSLVGENERTDIAIVHSLLAPGDSVFVTGRWRMHTPGRHVIGVLINAPDDERTDNDRAFISIRVSFPSRSVVVNEIMYEPDEGPEWLELYNRFGMPVDLEGWTLETADSTRSRTIVDRRMVVPSEGYMILAADTTLFRERFAGVAAPVLRPLGGWPALLNDGTRVVLRDPTRRVVDRVDYRADWSGTPGRSTERVHPDRPSNDTANWGPSAGIAGGTPGERNSLFTDGIPDRTTVDIQPNPFSPDGDGWEDETGITISIPETHAIVRMFIYDVTGRLQRTLMDEEPIGSRRMIAWNGLDDQGRRLRVGPYILYFEAMEPNTGRIRKIKTLIVLARHL